MSTTKQAHKPPGRLRSSIVARLNFRLFLRLLGIYFSTDLLLTLLFAGGVVVWSERQCGDIAALLPHQIPLAGIKIVDRAAAFCQLPELCFRCQRGDLLSFLRGIFCPADAGIFDINSVAELRSVVNAQCTGAGQKMLPARTQKMPGRGFSGTEKHDILKTLFSNIRQRGNERKCRGPTLPEVKNTRPLRAAKG